MNPNENEAANPDNGNKNEAANLHRRGVLGLIQMFENFGGSYCLNVPGISAEVFDTTVSERW